MNPLRFRWRWSPRFRPFVSVATLLCLVEVSCARIGDAPRTLDPAFSGTWTAPDIEVYIGHEEGIIHVVGVSEGGEFWDLLALTGQVLEIGLATASGQIWSQNGSDTPVLLGPVDASMRRFDNMLDLTLTYADRLPETIRLGRENR
jgi:hypothetical protein